MPDAPDQVNELQPRRLKACRTCRRQKMRCDGTPDAPCPRCVNAGVQCIFDLAERREQPNSVSSGGQKRKLEAMEQDLREMKDQMQGLLNIANIQTSQQENGPSWQSVPVRLNSAPRTNQNVGPMTSLHTAPSIRADPQVSQYHGSLFKDRVHSCTPDDVEGINDNFAGSSQLGNGPARNMTLGSEYMDRLPLHAPISAVHALSPPMSAGPSRPGALSAHLMDEYSAASSNAPPAVISGPPALPRKKQDCVSGIFEDEIQARNLLALYFAGANPFIPILDPMADTFDSLRLRSPFCLITVLYVALNHQQGTITRQVEGIQVSLRDLALKEARRLATESLFENPATLETVQGMILLAAYSRKVWFAIGHALQMASDLGLDRALDRLHDPAQTSALESYRHLSEARTWLVLHHLERELAFGTARQPRMKPIDINLLKKFLHHPITSSSDLRYISIVEVVQLRGEILSCIDSQSFASTSPLSWTDCFLRRIDYWYRHWDSHLEGQGIDGYSFHRASLWIQKSFAYINLYCVVLKKLLRENGQSIRSNMTELMRRTANITMQLLRFIRTSDSYRWHFNWAPAYSATMLTFLAMFALHVSRKWPQLIDRSTLMQDLNPVLRMLDNYSYIDNIADQLRDVVRQSSQDLAVGEEPSNGIYNQDEGNAHTVDVDARSFNAGESFIDFEDVDYFLTTGYLENWSFLEQGDQFAKSSMWRHNSAQ